MTEYYFIDKKTGAKKHSYFEGGEWREEVYHPPATAATKAKKTPARYVSSAVRGAGEAMIAFCMGDLDLIARPALEFFRADGERWGVYYQLANRIEIADDISQERILRTAAHEMFHVHTWLNLGQINEGAALAQEEAAASAYADRVVRGIRLMQGSTGLVVSRIW